MLGPGAAMVIVSTRHAVPMPVTPVVLLMRAVNRIRRLPIRRAVKESGALQLGSHPAESAAKISADCCHDGNSSYGYQGSDKPIFDRGDPGLVAD